MAMANAIYGNGNDDGNGNGKAHHGLPWHGNDNAMAMVMARAWHGMVRHGAA